MADANDHVAYYRKRRCQLLQVLERYRRGVYQSGKFIGPRLNRIDRLLAVWEGSKGSASS